MRKSGLSLGVCWLYGLFRRYVHMTGTGSDVGSAGGSARGSLRPGRNEDMEHVAVLTANLALKFVFMVCTASAPLLHAWDFIHHAGLVVTMPRL